MIICQVLYSSTFSNAFSISQYARHCLKDGAEWAEICSSCTTKERPKKPDLIELLYGERLDPLSSSERAGGRIKNDRKVGLPDGGYKHERSTNLCQTILGEKEQPRAPSSVDRIAISSVEASSVDHELTKLCSTFAAVYFSPSLLTFAMSSVAVRRRVRARVHLRILCSAAGRAGAPVSRPTDGRTRRRRTDHVIVAIVARVWITRHKIAPSF